MPCHTIHFIYIYIYLTWVPRQVDHSLVFAQTRVWGPGKFPAFLTQELRLGFVAFGIRYAWTGDCCDKRRSAAPCSRENPCCGVAQNSKIHQESRIITPILKFLSILSKSWMKYMELWWTLPIFASIPGQPLVLRAPSPLALWWDSSPSFRPTPSSRALSA